MAVNPTGSARTAFFQAAAGIFTRIKTQGKLIYLRFDPPGGLDSAFLPVIPAGWFDLFHFFPLFSS